MALPRATPRRSLRWKYAAFSLTLVGGLLALTGAVTAYFSWRDASQAQEALLKARAEAGAIRIAGFLASIEQPMRGLLSTAMQTGADADALRVEATRALQRLPPVTELRWIDARGALRVHVDRVSLDNEAAVSDYALDPRVIAARKDGRFASTVYFKRETEPYISLALAGRSAAEGVLLAEVNLRFVGEVVARERVGKAGRLYVVDGAGLLVAHPDAARVLARTDLSAQPQVADVVRGAAQVHTRGKSLDGAAVLVVGAPVAGLGWTVFAELPETEAMEPMFAALGRVALLAVLGLLLAFGASAVLAGRMVRPIRALGAGAEVIGAGRLDHRVDVRSEDELGALGAQINRMAERLQESYLTLESRIAERTAQLADANRAKTQFLAAASHDLRQPMHALSLTVGELGEQATDAALRPLVRRIERAVDALEGLLDALLDISMLDAGGVKPVAVDCALGDLLERVADELAPAAEAKDLRLRIAPTRAWVHTDPVLFGRILLNLVSNAIRYTHEGGVLVGCRRRGDAVEVCVVDTGVGIADDELQHVFREFYQAGDRERDRAQGLGLGLAIVERTAGLLGHPVAVRSRPGRGSIFSLRLPRATAPAASPVAVPAPGAAGDLADLRVLVLDDEADAREALADLLSNWGCDVRLARSADEARALARDGIDLFVCDLQLGAGENGIEVAESVRALALARVGVLILTADTSAAVPDSAAAHGFRLMHKPVRPARLRALLEQMR